MNLPQQLYQYSKNNKELFAKIIDPSILSPEKFLFNKDYKINHKRIVDVINGDRTNKKQIKCFKDFNNSYYLSLRSFDIDSSVGVLIPILYNCSFQCLGCNRNYDKNIKKQCCSLSAPISISYAELYSVYIPTESDLNTCMSYSKEKFVELHFPDLLDNILLR